MNRFDIAFSNRGQAYAFLKTHNFKKLNFDFKG